MQGSITGVKLLIICLSCVIKYQSTSLISIQRYNTNKIAQQDYEHLHADTGLKSADDQNSGHQLFFKVELILQASPRNYLKLPKQFDACCLITYPINTCPI